MGPEIGDAEFRQKEVFAVNATVGLEGFTLFFQCLGDSRGLPGPRRGHLRSTGPRQFRGKWTHSQKGEIIFVFSFVSSHPVS